MWRYSVENVDFYLQSTYLATRLAVELIALTASSEVQRSLARKRKLVKAAW
jgi:hypothetical protein